MGTAGTSGTAGTRWRWRWHPGVLLLLLLLAAPGAAAGSLGEPAICLVLDAALFLFSLILTALYCRLRLEVRRWRREAERQKEEAVYAGLGSGDHETYETLQMKHPGPPRDPPGTPP